MEVTIKATSFLILLFSAIYYCTGLTTKKPQNVVGHQIILGADDTFAFLLLLQQDQAL